MGTLLERLRKELFGFNGIDSKEKLQLELFGVHRINAIENKRRVAENAAIIRKLTDSGWFAEWEQWVQRNRQNVLSETIAKRVN